MSKYYNTYWRFWQDKGLNDFHYKWPAIKQLIPTKEKMKILDFGCGTGDILAQIININSNSTYYGVDVSEVALKRIKKRFPKANFYLVGDGEKIPLKSGSVDFVTALDVIEHVYNTKETIYELTRVLKPGGKMLVTTPYHGFLKNLILVTFFFNEYFHPQGSHIRYYSKSSLISELKKEGLFPIKFGYFGRFYPVPKAMYVLVEKRKK